MKLLVEAACQFFTNGCKILAEGIGLTLGISNYLTFNKYTFRVAFRFSWQQLFLSIST